MAVSCQESVQRQHATNRGCPDRWRACRRNFSAWRIPGKLYTKMMRLDLGAVEWVGRRRLGKMPGDTLRTSKKGTLKESVYESLKRMVQTGVLQPGSRLTELDLAARLKVSRTPLRESLNRLERDGLVTNKPRHGYFVTMVDVQALEHAFGVREVLDGHAAQLAAEGIGPEDKKRLRALVRRCDAMARRKSRPMEDLIEEMRFGFEIHRIIAQVSGNDFLAELLFKIYDKFQHFVWIELLWLDEWDITR